MLILIYWKENNPDNHKEKINFIESDSVYPKIAQFLLNFSQKTTVLHQKKQSDIIIVNGLQDFTFKLANEFKNCLHIWVTLVLDTIAPLVTLLEFRS